MEGFVNLLGRTTKLVKRLILGFKYRKMSISHPHLISLKCTVSDSQFLGPVLVAKGCNVKRCDVEGYSSIGENVTISNATVGRFCSIAKGCIINPRSHPLNRMTTSSFPYNRAFGINGSIEVFEKKSTIGNDVWIGANAIILPGVDIADGAVVGAGSIVTKNVKSHDIVAGNPATVIGKRKFFLSPSAKNHWYKWDEEKLLANMDFFLSTDS
ncbi:CatB-related O-acetyltransferase [Aliivibrio fischeri]|uniref:xenobiotic acyltransferase family protein n=1 Tax=Aliivibrio fischeri TaxID=668 RepID=UPI0007C5B5B5|nr:DapH/DapD/GlmU-related protein [Aliivibrio fischeri]